MRLATAAQVRHMDEHAIHQRGIGGDVLMETAARALVREAIGLLEEDETAPHKRRYLPTATGEVLMGERAVPYQYNDGRDQRPTRCAIFCGPGNNGGDGVAAARFLLEAGWRVRAFLVGDRGSMTQDCREMETRLLSAGGCLEDYDPQDPAQAAFAMGADLLIDAIFGIGLHSPVRGDALAAIQRLNAAPGPVVAADIPSGVEADTGRVLGQAVQAALTVTFTYAKPGHFIGKGALCTGRVTVAPIGIPEDLTQLDHDQPIFTTEPWQIQLPPRPRDAHKGDFGKVYLLAGSVGYTGAPLFAAWAAVRSGVGLVFLGVPGEIWPVIAAGCREAMPAPIPDDPAQLLEKMNACDAVLIGPGLGRSPRMDELLLEIIPKIKVPLVLDADGINLAAARIDILKARGNALTVLTPHDGEFARLLGRPLGEDRLAEARTFAREHGCVLVLKGHRTLTVFPNGAAYVNTTGNPGMARGGSGDVLAGVLTGLLGQKLPPDRAIPGGVWYHGRAGDLCAAALGETGMTPSDMVERLPQAFQI